MDNCLDPAIRRALPEGSVVLSISQHGRTNWAQGLKLETESPSPRKADNRREKKAYFIKVTTRNRALEMARGEFESHKAMHIYTPENTTRPIAAGPLETNPSHAFFMTEFRHPDPEKRPSPMELAMILRKLHNSSISSVDSRGRFGFPVTTFKGYVPLDNSWTDSWEEWFTRQFKLDVKFEQSVRGPDPEMDNELLEEFCKKVIPRLLRPLQTEGRAIKPCFVHTDIWHGNVHFDRESEVPIVFDALELEMFHHPRYGWGPEYLQAYIDLMPASEPKDDFEDRVALYAMRNYIVSAGLWDHWAYMRGVVKEEMKRLLAKYPNGYTRK
ncbi:Fructosamine kinase-domain-containing protein [Rhypophila decipiens]|uniref:protein-ribulosamine 3-kinase n=1 Tax=Rhypophila decipiens TaxID=261697 RepID=A0AAN6YDQ0_9PEZI|nr:Fructosamine kinase-domain-containing protein [Rhypophila decipiens]